MAWFQNLSLDQVGGFANQIKENVNLESPWSVAALSLAGVVATGFAGHYYIKYREQVDETANERIQLQNLCGALWYCSYNFQMAMPPIALQSNMFVIRLKSGGLVIYNPVQLSAVLKKQINAIGEVKFVIVGNHEHKRFFPEYVAEYPNIRLLVPVDSMEDVIQRLSKRNLHPPTNGILELAEVKPEGLWDDDELEHHLVRGFPWFNEIVLFHKPTQVLLTVDLAFHIRDGIVKMKNPNVIPLAVKYANKVGIYNRVGVSRNFRFIKKDKELLRQSIETICKWDFKGIGMAHGLPVAPAENQDVKSQWKEAILAIL